MVRLWVVRDMTVVDPFYAARDAASQALAVEIARSAGMDYDAREDDETRHAEVFLTGPVEIAEQALTDIAGAGIEVALVETNTEAERDRMAPLARAASGGGVGHTPSRRGSVCEVELVQSFRAYPPASS